MWRNKKDGEKVVGPVPPCSVGAPNKTPQQHYGPPTTFSPLSYKIAALLFFFLFTGTAWGATSLSDIATEQLEKEQIRVGARNPFMPADVKGEIDITSLTLEGLVIGEGKAFALVSGNIVRVGDQLGKYSVAKIHEGEIVLSLDNQEYHLNLEGYIESVSKKGKQNYSIEFRHADLRDSLRLLAKSASYNLITPEDMTGRLNLSFENTTLRDAINSILKVNGYNYAIESGIIRVGRSDQFVGGTDLLATTIALKYATAKDLVDKVKPLLSDKGSVTAEDRINVLSVKDYDANVENVRSLIEAVDKKDQQVLIEAHIIDATNEFSRSLGIQWGVTGTPDRLTIAGGDSLTSFTVGANAATRPKVNLGAANPTSAAALRIGQLPGGMNIDLQLSAAKQKGDIRIISKPNITTVNNLPAKIRSGVKIHVKSTSNITVGTAAGTGGGSTSGLQEIDTGIELKVTPQISPENLIKLKIEATESEADFSKTVDGIPAVIDNVASTTVFLKDGETAVIGGLIKVKNSNSKRSVPGFSKIPVVGLFFKSKTKSKTQSELMVFITPRILR